MENLRQSPEAPTGRPLTRWLQNAPPWVFNSSVMFIAFFTYFCVYAYRKPFAAATYEGFVFFGTAIELKTALVIAQILGYALSKLIGIKFCSEITRGQRARMLVSTIVAAELALVLFAIVPPDMKVLAVFLNGLTLGMAWGLIVWYLEGRQVSELLLAALSCSFIVSSGAVKDVGVLTMTEGPLLGLVDLPPVSQFWMPAVTGLLFLLPFLIGVWLLDQVPDPTADDVAQRTERKPMTGAERLAFMKQFLPGMLMLIGGYFFLTAYRDYRDSYAVDLLIELGQESRAAAITSIELPVAFLVMIAMGLLFLIKNNQAALFAIFTLMTLGMMLIGLATWLLSSELIGGFTWMLLTGLGSYLAYVPYNSVLFDRLIASTRTTGTAVFCIYVADTMGYTGSILVQLTSDFMGLEGSRLEFLKLYSYFLALSGTALLVGSCTYFVFLVRKPKPVTPPALELSK